MPVNLYPFIGKFNSFWGKVCNGLAQFHFTGAWPECGISCPTCELALGVAHQLSMMGRELDVILDLRGCDLLSNAAAVLVARVKPVSYTHLTLPTIYSV